MDENPYQAPQHEDSELPRAPLRNLHKRLLPQTKLEWAVIAVILTVLIALLLPATQSSRSTPIKRKAAAESITNANE